MADSAKLNVRPASKEEAGLFFAMKPEEDAALGCIGHVRMDFGRGGREFWHTWHPRGPEEWNSQAFKDELTTVVDALRDGVLKDLNGMREYCRIHGGVIPGGWTQNHGFVVETDNYRYCLRCNPVPGDYQGYLVCFDKQVQEMNQSGQIHTTPYLNEAQEKVHYPIEDQVNDCYRYMGIQAKDAHEMTEDELLQAEAELGEAFEWVEHEGCVQSVPQHKQSGEIMFQQM